MARFIFPEDFFESSWIEEAFQDMDRIWANVGTGFPPYDVLVNKENGDTLLRMAIAGYEPGSITVTTENDYIIVEGAAQKKDEKYTIVTQGIKSSGFKTKYPISSKFDLTKITASFSNGMLEITVPIAEEKKARKVSINL